jgi:uncharacterized protein YeaO (DUF488 family)
VSGKLQIKRTYEPPERSDGHRILVERLWPRGVRKDDLKLYAWIREVAPSTALRQWFAHDPQKWSEFRRRYFTELDKKPETWKPILVQARKSAVTLLFSSKDAEHNNVVALRDYLMARKKVRATPTTRI